MSDIDELISAADKEQKNRQFSAQSIQKRNRSEIVSKVTKLRWVMLVAIFIVALISIAIPLMPISERIIRADLNTTLDTAQSAVEKYRKVNGQLQDRVPSALLATLVEYERFEEGYRMSITMNGVTISRER